MKKSSEGILQILAALAIAAAVFYFSGDVGGLGAFGYAGVFAIALLSSATILFPAPGWAIIIALAQTMDPVLLGIFAGAGSAIGEMTGFLAGDGVRDILNSRIKESKKVEELVKKYDVAGIFVLSFIPNPLFDIAGVVAGGLKMRWWHFLIACAAGRILRFALLAALGSFTLGLIG